jgi:hypothetical protein
MKPRQGRKSMPKIFPSHGVLQGIASRGKKKVVRLSF